MSAGELEAAARCRVTVAVEVDDDVAEWMKSRSDESEILRRFVGLMATELAANSDKGDRPGWLQMSPAAAISELLYHAGKLSLAVREVGSGKPPDPRTSGFTGDDVVEYSADVANCALMVLDCMGAWGPIEADPLPPEILAALPPEYRETGT